MIGNHMKMTIMTLGLDDIITQLPTLVNDWLGCWKYDMRMAVDHCGLTSGGRNKPSHQPVPALIHQPVTYHSVRSCPPSICGETQLKGLWPKIK